MAWIHLLANLPPPPNKTFGNNEKFFIPTKFCQNQGRCFKWKVENITKAFQGEEEVWTNLSAKELPRVNRTYDPVEDQRSRLFSFSSILLEFCNILVKFYKNLHFTEFHPYEIIHFTSIPNGKIFKTFWKSKLLLNDDKTVPLAQMSYKVTVLLIPVCLFMFSWSSYCFSR